ncbi:dihydropteroate synthase [Vagococcus penaei]|nr:dihydropteroate synthase [Vagococcus penaei]
MGIVNVTPDSFSDGGDFSQTDRAVNHALTLIEEGADIIDLGGQSTRPGYTEISAEEELSRVLPVVKALRKVSQIPISVDTYFPSVAEAVIQAGASIINDIKGFDTPGMGEVIAHYQTPIILMHSRQRRSDVDVITDLQEFYQEKVQLCQSLGVPSELICFDPGIGFHKTLEENQVILANPKLCRFEEYPLLYGVSRKRTIAHIIDESRPKERDYGSVTASLYAMSQGVDIVRVHQVKGMRDALTTWSRLTQELVE